MLELKVKENIGYKITMQCTVVNGANEELMVVLGEHSDGRYATWITIDGKDFNIGHYFAKGQRFEAMKDMFRRAEKWDIDYADNVLKTPREMLEDEGYFGIVMWCDEDLGAALNQAGYSPTERNIELLRDESEQALCDDMIERGWETIDSVIGILENEYELDKDEEE
jgi:hypothetical protein